MNAAAQLLKRAGNEALRVNPTVADIDITTHGSDWLWAVFSVMALSGLVTMFWSLKVSRGERAFHYLSAAILATASVAYFSMASDLGATPIRVEFLNYGPNQVNGQRPTRSIWYARYIDWTITTPLLLLEILLVSGLPLSTVFITIFFDIVMIVTGLIGALVESTYKWGFYTMGCVAMFYVFWVIYGPGLKSASHLGADFKKSYLYSSLLLTVLWTLYPIAWGLADGSNTISPDGEMVFYGVLDLLAKPVFALFHLFSLRRCNYSSLHLKSGKFSDYEDLSANHYRTMEGGKATEAGIIAGNGNVNGARTTGTTTTGTNVTGANVLDPAPATTMQQAHIGQ
ncbi:related to YRO2 - putative plasma membrane protein, transcriptionally regulated by Haa1p [Ustilago trichophora]|uniref:Related to YRO2 - putative plasma membrane protein, transcriptionally regulated by Haa1p n=1 Tax=Ustilago trichophora TaxID=86804 RepID=A0A5C3E4R7_9BASI|nr:related to YRO2 - putative plasma membrane protein, transcriptionally regulated by Haa1p [Ustilago trichophora]